MTLYRPKAEVQGIGHIPRIIKLEHRNRIPHVSDTHSCVSTPCAFENSLDNHRFHDSVTQNLAYTSHALMIIDCHLQVEHESAVVCSITCVGGIADWLSPLRIIHTLEVPTTRNTRHILKMTRNCSNRNCARRGWGFDSGDGWWSCLVCRGVVSVLKVRFPRLQTVPEN